MKGYLRNYLSPLLLLLPAILFPLLIIFLKENPALKISSQFPFLPWQFIVLAISGAIATLGGILDWRFHRNPLNLKIPKKERDAEAFALGLGGIPMFILMVLATFSSRPNLYLVPIILVLIYTVVAICYDEFVFHIKRCGKKENTYHRMLVFGNGFAWLSWFHFIYG